MTAPCRRLATPQCNDWGGESIILNNGDHIVASKATVSDEASAGLPGADAGTDELLETAGQEADAAGGVPAADQAAPSVPDVAPAKPAGSVAAGTGYAPGGRILLYLAAAVVALVGVWFAKDVLAPVAVAAVIVIIAHPVRHPLERRGWPGWAATTAVVAVSFAILAGLGLLLTVAAAQFIRMLPNYSDEFTAVVDSLVSALGSLGFHPATAAGAFDWLTPSFLLNAAYGVADSILGLATAFFFVLAYVIFMAADAATLGRRKVGFAPRPAVIAERYFRGVRRYYVVNATFGLIVAVVDGLLLWWMGIPVPIVWAVLAFVTNFIPNIGFIIGVIPPAIFALVVGGWPLALLVVAAYCVVNVVLQVMVQPKFVSDAVGLTMTLTFFSVVFWTLVIGPIGAILCIPLTLLVRAIALESSPHSKHLRALSGDTEPTS